MADGSRFPRVCRCGKTFLVWKHEDDRGWGRSCSRACAAARPLADRLDGRWFVEPLFGCWLWTGTTRNGYGSVKVNRRPKYAHRAIYEHYRGPIPDGLQLDHLCRNTTCVNPAHLDPVTQRENVMRGYSPAAGYVHRTHCKNGHPWTEENTYHSPSKPMARRCRMCAALRGPRRRKDES